MINSATMVSIHRVLEAEAHKALTIFSEISLEIYLGAEIHLAEDKGLTKDQTYNTP